MLKIFRIKPALANQARIYVNSLLGVLYGESIRFVRDPLFTLMHS